MSSPSRPESWRKKCKELAFQSFDPKTCKESSYPRCILSNGLANITGSVEH